ncbi:D-inositol-3-phosphate glycosyltransferase [Tsukamurella asaccharolytica]|uniref:D-inositol-3-phosphate glycosyltransferase n=1 Tax=Tsukamurella asaccharolytica TaxID=2592067 RepID=A0A5C5RDA8_9ACTN|nr:D-inositol-3-phosphate glycosyltransferase [Tsukamurella asaccharolytica]TWS20514.1 D-inositol-3-phosphate glycosyltransferase [Tsukamurella asaccharolytica]
MPTGKSAASVPRRIAVLSVHTSPLAQPGTGDAGGMNVYIWQTSLELAKRGIEVEIFTRATSSADQPVVEAAPGIRVRNIVAGPFEGLDKTDLPAQLCAFAAGVQRAEAREQPGYFDLIHSHYWLSGQVGWLARDRWGVPLVHTAHTLAAVKNDALAVGDTAEPQARLIGEQQVSDEADRLIVNTEVEAGQLTRIHGVPPGRIDIVHPGADLGTYTPGDGAATRAELGISPDELVLTFVGRIQPHKAPDLLLRAAAPLIHAHPERRIRVLVVGGPSGTGLERPDALIALARELGIEHAVTFGPPRPPAGLAEVYRASDVVVVPSYSESFGLVAVEAQACGTPVVAARVGGLPVAVADGVSGRLVDGHEPQVWTAVLDEITADPGLRQRLSDGAAAHAQRFSWARTADGLLDSYGKAIAARNVAVRTVRRRRRRTGARV